MSKITRETIDKVTSLPIEEVIGKVVSLKKFGGVLKARCPFHSEKTASFTVNPNKNIFKCFGCGKGGDSINFFMEHEGYSFAQSVKHICETHNIECVTTGEEVDDAVQKETDTILKINREACDFFKSKMNGSKSFEKAKERGYLDETIEQFEMGHTSSLFSHLYKHLSSKGFTDKDIEKSGVCKKKTDGTFVDFFRDRWIFPIHNVFGKIVGFSGRRNIETMLGKYINSPETRVFKKSNELFGLFLAKKEIMKLDECIAIEGATDVISLFQNNIKHVVGTLGTAFSKEHARIIKRYTDKVILLYDGDQAGLKAMFKACEELLKEGLFVFICSLPDGKDPDSMVREIGGEEMLKYINTNKKEFIKHRISLLLDNAQVTDKIRLAKELHRMINLHPDKIARAVLLNDYNKEFGFDSKAINVKREEFEPISELPMEFHILRIMLYYMNDWGVCQYFENTPEELYPDYFSDEKKLNLFKYLMKNRDVTISEILHNENQEISDTATEIMNTKFDNIKDENFDIMSVLYSSDLAVCEKQIKKLQESEIDEFYQTKMNRLTKFKENLEKDIFNLINERKK